MKRAHSWSKPDAPGLIGRKQVDWSIFQEGTTIPIPFHEDFTQANGGDRVRRGDRKRVVLVLDGEEHEAFFYNKDRQGHASDTLQILYHSNQAFLQILASRFARSLRHLEHARAQATDDKKKYERVPEEHAEFLEFYDTGTPFRYRIQTIARGDEPGPPMRRERLTYRVINSSDRRTGLLMMTPEAKSLQHLLPPPGYAAVSVEGGTLYALIPPARIAINVLREAPDDSAPNRMSQVLLRWFGPSAWMPGEANRVALEIEGSSLRLVPLPASSGSLLPEAWEVTDRKPPGRLSSITREELAATAEEAQRVGDEGEALVAAYLEQRQRAAQIQELRWVSRDHPLAPYDFEFREGGATRRVDVKSTKGPVGNPLYISLGEMREMAEGPAAYDVYRVHSIARTGAQLQIARDVRTVAQRILAGLDALGPGVSVPQFKVHPHVLPFETGTIALGRK